MEVTENQIMEREPYAAIGLELASAIHERTWSTETLAPAAMFSIEIPRRYKFKDISFVPSSRPSSLNRFMVRLQHIL